MSSRRSRSRQSGVSRISDDQIADLVSKLQQLIPEIRNRRSDKVVIWSFSQLSQFKTSSYFSVVFIFLSRDKFGLTHCHHPSPHLFFCGSFSYTLMRCGTQLFPLPSLPFIIIITILFYFTLQVSASKVLQETCNYIRNLHREVDDLSDRLSALLDSTDTDSDQAAIIRSLLM